MKTAHIHRVSLLLALVSLVLEVAVNQSWIGSSFSDIVFGVSLGLILIALGLNVKVIRTMGIASEVKKRSQFILLLISLYAFLVYGLEVI